MNFVNSNFAYLRSINMFHYTNFVSLVSLACLPQAGGEFSTYGS